MAGGPEAGGFARVSPKLWCAKGLLPFHCRSRNHSASPVSTDRKTGFNVGLTQQPRSGGTTLHGMRMTSPTRVGSETNKMMVGSATIKYVS
jgi:hypothetical protein